MRWLILPALSLALAVAIVSAADVKLDGGVGDRAYRPTSVSDIRNSYKLGMGQLVVDLRGVKLPPGDHPIHLQLGVGDARVVVPQNVCVASKAEIGAGAVNVFDSDHGGADFDWEDRPQAPAGTPRVVIDANIGLGALEVSHTNAGFHGGGGRHGPFGNSISAADLTGNAACAGATS